MVFVVAMAGPLAGEVMSLHASGKPLALAHRGDIDPLSGGEQIDGDFLADGESARIVHPQLHHSPARLHLRLAEVARLRLGESARFAGSVGDLDGGIAIP